MKALRTIAFAICLLGLVLPATVQAGAGKRKHSDQALNASKILKKFGTNGVIHPGAESDALRKAFKSDQRLKPLDTNNDGKLEDREIAAIKPKHMGGKKKKNV
jgi:hypothetical protein